MSLVLLCPRYQCPYRHDASEPCPPEWTDVPSDGGDTESFPQMERIGISGWKVATWLVLGLMCWALLYAVVAAVLP